MRTFNASNVLSAPPTLKLLRKRARSTQQYIQATASAKYYLESGDHFKKEQREKYSIEGFREI